MDIVLDAVGGEVAERSLGCLAPFGRLVVYGVSSKQIAPFAGSQLMLHNQSVVGYWLTGWLTGGSGPATTRIVNRLLDLHREGRLRAVIRHAYALADAADAHRQIAARGTAGKVVLTT